MRPQTLDSLSYRPKGANLGIQLQYLGEMLLLRSPTAFQGNIGIDVVERRLAFAPAHRTAALGSNADGLPFGFASIK
jgi:hypothetical protein